MDSLEGELRDTTHALARTRNPLLYTPRVDFPTTGPDELRPDGFKALIQRVMEECKDQGLSLRDVDCSEYPCVAWTNWDTTKNKQFDMGRCKPWHDTFGDMTSMMTAQDNPDAGVGGERFTAFYAVPTDAAARKRVKERMAERLRAMLLSYGANVDDE